MLQPNSKSFWLRRSKTIRLFRYKNSYPRLLLFIRIEDYQISQFESFITEDSDRGQFQASPSSVVCHPSRPSEFVGSLAQGSGLSNNCRGNWNPCSSQLA